MNSSQLLDYRRLQTIICNLTQNEQNNSNYYSRYNDIIPVGDLQFNIGSSNYRFNDLYLGPGTIYMGDPLETQLHANNCNVFWASPGMGAPYFEFMNSNYPGVTEGPNSGLHVFYNVQCNDLWKVYPDGVSSPFGTFRGETGPQGPPWQFSNDLIPTIPGLNIGSSGSNINNLYLSNAIYINGTIITSLSGYLNFQGKQIATSQDITNGVSTISSIVSYGLSSIVGIDRAGVSSLSSIVSYGLSSVAGVNSSGISSLSSIVSYGLSSVAGVNSPGISSLSSIVSYGLSTITQQQQPLLGGVLRVDSIYGNDTTAPTNRYLLAFKTITGAMTNSTYGDTIWVLPGTYNETIVFSNGVSLRGISLNSVNIAQSNATSNTILVTMAQNTRLEDVTLTLKSSSSNAQILTGVLFSNVQTSAKVRTVVMNIDNSAMTCNVLTNVYGVWSAGNSSTAISSSDALQRVTINVTSSGLGRARCVYNDGSNFFAMRDVNLYCKDNPLYSNTSGGTYYGIETNNANAILQIKTSTTYGYTVVGSNTGADMSQTLGKIILSATDLPNRTANGFGFTSSTAQASIPFNIAGSPGNYDYTYLVQGSIPSDNQGLSGYYGIRTPTISIFDQMAFQCQTNTTTVYAYLFKNSVIQPAFTLVLSNGGPTFVNTSNISLTMTPQDNYAIMLSNVGGTFGNRINYPLVTISFY